MYNQNTTLDTIHTPENTLPGTPVRFHARGAWRAGWVTEVKGSKVRVRFFVKPPKGDLTGGLRSQWVRFSPEAVPVKRLDGATAEIRRVKRLITRLTRWSERSGSDYYASRIAELRAHLTMLEG